MAKCHPQESTQNRHGHHQAEVEQSHVLMKRHKAKMPEISNRRSRLVEHGYGVHVDNKHADEKRRGPARYVPDGSLSAEVLPDEQDPGDERERERNRVIPK